MLKISKVALFATTSLAAMTLGATIAHADIKPSNGGAPVTVTNIGGKWQYTYSIVVDEEQQVNPGSYFTMYDFSGFDGVIGTNPLWSVSTSLLTPDDSLGAVKTSAVYGGVKDSATQTNVKFTYTGTGVLNGPQTLGLFTLQSIYGPTTLARHSFVGAGFINGTNPPVANGNGTTYLAPTLALIPEPSEYAFMGFVGASLLGLVVRARRRKSVVTA